MAQTDIDGLTETEAASELERLARVLGEANAAYHTRDMPEISDAEYDQLKQLNAAIEARFPALAAGLALGPAGLDPVFSAVGVGHQLDGHRLYQQRVEQQASAALASNPNDRPALWSLALLKVLQNRPLEADRWFERLQSLEPASPWPAAYRAVVLTAAGRLWQASAVADQAQAFHPSPVLEGLGDLSGVMGSQLWRLPAARRSVPAAVTAVEEEIGSQTP